MICPKGWDALLGTIPQNGESTGTRSGSDKQDVNGTPTVNEDLLEPHVADDWIQHEWETPRVWDIYPLVSPREGDRVF